MSGRISGYLRQHHIGLIAIFLILGGTAFAATQPGADGDIDACFEKKSGDLDILKGKKCGKGEKAVAWAADATAGTPGVQGAQGPAGANGADGAQGTPGTARAYGIVQPNGLLTSSSNATALRAGLGVYCISVPGVSSANTPIVLTTDQSAGNAPGDTTWADTANIMQGNPSRHTEAQFDGATNESCPASDFEIQTFMAELDTNNETGSVHRVVDAGFSFIVP